MQRQRGELVPIGDALADLGGPVKAIRGASPQALHHFTQADQVNQLVGASEADPDLGFMARLLVLCWGSWRGWSLPMLLSARAVGRSSTSSASTAASAPSRCRPGRCIVAGYGLSPPQAMGRRIASTERPASSARVFKTEFILDYLSQPALRTRIRRGLLKGEQLHTPSPGASTTADWADWISATSNAKPARRAACFSSSQLSSIGRFGRSIVF